MNFHPLARLSMGALSYSGSYYERRGREAEASAPEVVPLIMQLFSPKTVVDVGCGKGAWTRAYKDASVEVLGIDGYDVKDGQLLISTGEFERHDLSRPLRLGRRFDLVNCLEVAEHLPASRARSFVADLCQLADVVVFSAAVPGQGGTHHINEQWPSYWIPFFEENGFQAIDCIRSQIWRNEKIAWWYVQNMFVFIRRSRLTDFPAVFQTSCTGPTDLVHPRAYVEATVPREMSPRMLREVLKALPYFPSKILQLIRR